MEKTMVKADSLKMGDVIRFHANEWIVFARFGVHLADKETEEITHQCILSLVKRDSWPTIKAVQAVICIADTELQYIDAVSLDDMEILTPIDIRNT